MSVNQAMVMRIKREMEMLERDPPPGICAWPKQDVINVFEAKIEGPSGTPYEKGIFKLELNIPDRYPFEPPKVRFITQVYHPNIDSGGRICLDTLVMPPKGSWAPSLNISTLLASIQSLIAEPNPDDGLMLDITNEYKHNRARFNETAKMWTAKYATENQQVVSSTSSTHQQAPNLTTESKSTKSVNIPKTLSKPATVASKLAETKSISKAAPTSNVKIAPAKEESDSDDDLRISQNDSSDEDDTPIVRKPNTLKRVQVEVDDEDDREIISKDASETNKQTSSKKHKVT